MRHFLIYLIFFLSFPVMGDEFNRSCEFNGIPLYGKVMIVYQDADINVMVVNNTPDLRVQVVNSNPNSCGKWQFVTSSYDFTIEYVYSNPDITINYVSSRPGMP